MVTNFRLSSSSRLKRKKLFDEVFATGKSIRTAHISVFYKETVLPEGVNLQAAFTASKRKFKKAVDRNKLKRLMREAYRTQRNPLELELKASKRQIAVVFVYTSTLIIPFSEVKTSINNLLQKLEKL